MNYLVTFQILQKEPLIWLNIGSKIKVICVQTGHGMGCI